MGILSEVAFSKSGSVVLCVSHSTFIYSRFLLRTNHAGVGQWVRVGGND